MKIKLHQGATLTDATKAMIRSIDNSDLSFSHVVMIPDRFSLQCEKLILSLLGKKALFNVRVVNLTKFSVELLNKLGVNISNGEVLSSGETILLTARAIDNTAKDFKTLKKGGIEFCYEVSKLIAQFKSSGVKPEDLNVKAQGMTGNKYHDLSLIYREYENLLNGKLDANARLSLLNEKLKNSKILSNTKIYFAQFEAFTKEGYNLIKTFSTCANEVNISLTEPLSIGNEYIYEKDIFEKVKKLSNESGAFVEVLNNQEVFEPQKEAIIKGLYSYQKVKCENKGFYNLYSCISGSEAVESTAKLIRYLVFKGKKYKDIQIAVGGLGSVQSQIENIFSQYDIPFYIDSSVTADKTILGNLIRSYFETVIMGYSYDKLVDLLSNNLVNENLQLVEKCQHLFVNGKRRYKMCIEKDFANADILADLEKSKSPSEFSKVICSILERADCGYKNILKRLEEGKYLKERNINIQVEEIIKETIGIIERENNQKLNAGEYFKLFNLLLSFRQVSTVPIYTDGVYVGDATESYFGESDTLIILKGEDLPALSNDNGLLDDQDLKLNFNSPIEPTIRMINRRMRFKFFSLLTLAKRRLVVFTERIDQDGKKKEAPTYIKNLNDIFDQQELKAGNIFFARKSDNLDINLLSAPLKRGREFDKDEKKQIDRKGYSGDIESLVFKDGKARVTQIEQYFSCPFKHFATYGLKLKEFEIEKFDPRDIGNICHKGAEMLLSQIIKKNNLHEFDKEKISQFIDKNFLLILEKENLTEKIEQTVEKNALIKFIKNQMLVLFENIIKELKSTSFKPSKLEYKFDNQSVGDGKITLVGKADRIDEAGDYLRIIDYKTGTTGNVLKELKFGQKLQLVLYEKFACEHFKKMTGGVFYFDAKFDYSKEEEQSKILLRGLAPYDETLIPLLDNAIEVDGKSDIISIYKSKKDGTYKGSAISKVDMKNLFSYAEKLTSKAIEEICEGYIEPKPHADSCRGCRYASLCGYEIESGQRTLSNDD